MNILTTDLFLALQNTNTLWLLFFGVVLVFFFYSIFLFYHWFRYGMNFLISLLATIIYSVVSLGILLVMLTSFATLIT